LKLWSVRSFEQAEDDIEPYITLRGHTAPIFTIAGQNGSQANDYQRVVYTAGAEGTIRVWQCPQVAHVNPDGDTIDGKHYCLAAWSDGSTEPIWELSHH